MGLIIKETRARESAKLLIDHRAKDVFCIEMKKAVKRISYHAPYSGDSLCYLDLFQVDTRLNSS